MAKKQMIHKIVMLLLAAVCLLGCLTVSLAAADMAHECSGELCFVCLCTSLGKQLAGTVLLPASLCVLVLIITKCVAQCQCRIFPTFWTPVYLKVKLSN